METEIEKTLTALRSRHFNASYAENVEEACLQIVNLIPKGAVVGVGDSATVRQVGILKILEQKGVEVWNAYKTEGTRGDPDDAHAYHMTATRKASRTDVFIAGTNALTQDGRLVNVDAVGNRVSGMVWGHPVSVIVVGRNKIVKDLEEAFHRIRAMELCGRKRKTPCVETGECEDCRSSDRICNVFTIIENKPFYTDLNVVVVNEDLGLGWDKDWPEDRIKHIRESYKRFAWLPEMNYR